MRNSLILYLFGSFAVTLSPAVASASTVASSSINVLAYQLVESTVPKEMILRDAKKAYSDNFRASFLRNPKAQAAAERMPGLLDAILNAGRSKIDNVISSAIDSIKTNLSSSYATSLTPAELHDAVYFYSGPVGRKLVAATPALAAGSDVQKILDASEFATFIAFSKSSAGQKMAALMRSQASEISTAVNSALTTAQPQIDAAGIEAGQAYMRAHQPK